jgi:hypothetical protein
VTTLLIHRPIGAAQGPDRRADRLRCVAVSFWNSCIDALSHDGTSHFLHVSQKEADFPRKQPLFSLLAYWQGICVWGWTSITSGVTTRRYNKKSLFWERSVLKIIGGMFPWVFAPGRDLGRLARLSPQPVIVTSCSRH